MKNEKKEIKYFSMFTGIGGFELGIERANQVKSQQFTKECNSSDKQGKPISSSKLVSSKSNTFNCIGFSENDKYCSELLKKRFPEIKNYGDATKIIPTELPDFNFLVGGFPCQSFSIAGKRKGFEDTRGTLFYEILRTLEVKRPEYILLENVKGLLSHDNGRTFAIILASLSKLGYVIQWMVLNSKFFGVPQNRERVFIIGSLRGEPIPEILPLGESNQEIDKRLEKKPIIIGTTKSDTAKGTNSRSWVHDIDGIIGAVNSTEYKQPKQIMVQPVQLVNINRAKKPYNKDDREMKLKIRDDETSYTVKSAAHEFMVKQIMIPTNTKLGYDVAEEKEDGIRLQYEKSKTARGRVVKGSSQALQSSSIPGVLDNMRIRRLTPIECERLQGFPDNWTEGFSDTQRYKMMGNAVTVNVIKAIAERLFKGN